jgi:hypothetical protein
MRTLAKMGAASLGVNSYLNRYKTPQPEEYQLSPEKQAALQEQLYGFREKAGAANNYNNVMIPRPTAVPQIKSPGPAVANSPQIQRDSSSIGAYSKPKTEPGKDAMGGGESAFKTTTAAEKSALDPALATLIAGGAGGIGGYLAGEHVVSPLLRDREKGIEREIAEKERTLGRWRTARRYTPIALAALGAVALASLAAKRARKDERGKIQMQMMAGHLQPYDQTGAGYGAADQVQMGAPYGEVYG